MANKGDWACVKCVVLGAGERAPQVPQDTSNVPLVMWTKGYLLENANIGDTVTVKTRVGRLQEGELIEVNPTYRHSYGNFVPELNKIGDQLRQLLGGNNE